MKPERGDARTRLLDAALGLVREKGFAATSVDDLCRAAGVTKGAFFHHFPSKEALGVAAAEHWTAVTSPLFASAPYHAPEDPLDRVLGYLDFRTAILTGTTAEFTCFAGTTLQEIHVTSDAIRRACGASILGHAETLEADIAAAIARHGTREPVDAASLARHTQVVLQGAFILAKAEGGPRPAAESIDHLKRYIRLLFMRGHEEGRP